MRAQLGPDVLQAMLDAVAKAGSVNAAARMLGIPEPTAHSRWRRARAWAAARGATPPDATPPLRCEPPRRPTTADECWALLDAYIGRARIPPPSPPTPRPGASRRRIVVASDFHAKFTDLEAVATLIADESADTDTLILAGDLLDHFALSRFVKYELCDLREELAFADALLAQLAQAFADILVIDGSNHHDRFERMIRSTLPPDLVWAIEHHLIADGRLSLVRALTKRYPNIREAPVMVGTYRVDWCTQVGDLVVTHAEKYSKVPGSALRGVEEWLTDQHAILGLQPWRVLVQAHTHQLGIFPFKADRLLVECGCMASTMAYQFAAKVAGRPQRQGYVTLVQQDGVTDLNSVRFRWLNAEAT